MTTQTTWEYLYYDEDGVVVYKCNGCNEEIRTDTHPGIVVDRELVTNRSCPGEGWTLTNMRSGIDKIPMWERKVKPHYVPYWHFCPFCGAEWTSTVYDGRYSYYDGYDKPKRVV